ncbi:MAG: hypothetical protein ACP5LD_10510 [Desulfomonilaceae bacterium]
MLVDLKEMEKKDKDLFFSHMKQADFFVVLASGVKEGDVIVYGLVTKTFLRQCIKALTEALELEPEEEPS